MRLMLDVSQQVHMFHPVKRRFDVTVHDGGGRGNAQAMRCRDDIDPLFDRDARYVRDRLGELLATYQDILPMDLRASIEQVRRQIDVEQEGYALTPTIFGTRPNVQVLFGARFDSMVKLLGSLARQAEKYEQN